MWSLSRAGVVVSAVAIVAAAVLVAPGATTASLGTLPDPSSVAPYAKPSDKPGGKPTPKPTAAPTPTPPAPPPNPTATPKPPPPPATQPTNPPPATAAPKPKSTTKPSPATPRTASTPSPAATPGATPAGSDAVVEPSPAPGAIGGASVSAPWDEPFNPLPSIVAAGGVGGLYLVLLVRRRRRRPDPTMPRGPFEPLAEAPARAALSWHGDDEAAVPRWRRRFDQQDRGWQPQPVTRRMIVAPDPLEATAPGMAAPEPPPLDREAWERLVAEVEALPDNDPLDD